MLTCDACKEAIDSREASVAFDGRTYHDECIVFVPPVIRPIHGKEARARIAAKRKSLTSANV